MKTHRFDINHKPLRTAFSFSLPGGVPDRQNFDADINEYTPDYTLTPLVIQPHTDVIDADGIIPSGPVNASLANIRWYQILGGVRTLISTSDANYEITQSGTSAGQIKLKKNLNVGVPLTLEFYAEYVDTRTGQLFTFQGSYLVRCDNATPCIPQLQLDAADQTIYNPFVDVASQTVRARLLLGTVECPAAKRLFTWEKQRPDNSWSAVGSDILDYELTVSADGASVTVNRNLMGDQLNLRCRARYDRDGNPASKPLDDSCPVAVVQFVRRLPKFEFDIEGVPTNINPDIKQLRPGVRVWDVNGTISNPERELMILWYIATNKATGTLSYSQIAQGASPVISTAPFSQQYGAVLGVDAQDAGPLKAATDSDGVVFTDADGSILLIK